MNWRVVCERSTGTQDAPECGHDSPFLVSGLNSVSGRSHREGVDCYAVPDGGDDYGLQSYTTECDSYGIVPGPDQGGSL